MCDECTEYARVDSAEDERERIIELLEQTESPSHLWGGIAWSIALIKGEQ